MSTEDPRPAAERDLFSRVLPAPPGETAFSSPAMDGDDQELELRLCLGGGAARCKGGRDEAGRGSAGGWEDRCRILTAGDFGLPGAGHPAARAAHLPPASSPRPSTSSVSSSSSSSLAAGTKRASESIDPEARSNSPSQVVVGWPPIRAYRVNNLVNHLPKDQSARYANAPAQGAEAALVVGSSAKISAARESVAAAIKEPEIEKKKASARLIKVNMDGMAIGRKVDLNAHGSYNALALALEDMFHKTPNISQAKKTSKLLDGSSEFVLTYEDKDGDWMLVGDVPWGMFLNSVRRLRIMRTCDANVLAPGYQPTPNGLQSIHR